MNTSFKVPLLRPIKAPSEQVPFTDPRIQYPMMGSIKYDGFRGLLINGVFYSPVLKPYRNQNLPSHFAEAVELSKLGWVLDGELWSQPLSFNELQSRISSVQGSLTSVEYHIFDAVRAEEWGSFTPFYHDRYLRLIHLPQMSNCKVVHQHLISSAQEAETFYEDMLSAEHEGVILRSPFGRYKNNRCTHNESNMLKFKAFSTSDGVITKVIQRRKLKEDLEREYAPTGLLEKVHTKDSYTLDDAVGAVEVLFEGVLFQCAFGRGFSYKEKQELWTKRDRLPGRHVEFKHMKHGAKDRPRIGSIVRFRYDLDDEYLF